MKVPKYIRACECKKTDRPPVWMMRQAGRYLPEYRKCRHSISFKEMMKTPELACKVTLQPIDRFGMDAAILFSDILVTADCLGASFDFIEKQGPIFDDPIRTLADVAKLTCENVPEALSYVTQTISLLKPELKERQTPLIGFAGAPFTVASYMIEGGPSQHLKKSKSMMTQAPEIIDALIKKLTHVTIDYLNAQINAGVDALQLFDTWAGLLDPAFYEKYSYHPITEIISNLNNPTNIPVTVFSKQSAAHLSKLIQTGATVISLDWQCDLKEMKTRIPSSIAIQGNLDPHWLYAPEQTLIRHVEKQVAIMSDRPGYIFNLGHGIMPDVDPEKVKCVVDTIKNC